MVKIRAGLNFHWNVGLKYGTGMWDWNVRLERATGTCDWNVRLDRETGTWDSTGLTKLPHSVYDRS